MADLQCLGQPNTLLALDERPVEAFVVSIFKAASFLPAHAKNRNSADGSLLKACVHWCIRNHSTAIFDCQIPKLLVMHKWRRYGSQLYQKQLLLYSCAVLQYSIFTIREDIFQNIEATMDDTANTSFWPQIRLFVMAFTTSCNLLYFTLKELQQLKKEMVDNGTCWGGLQEYFLDMWCVLCVSSRHPPTC